MLAMAEVKAATGETEAVKTLLDEVVAICTPLDAVPLLAQATALILRLKMGPSHTGPLYVT